MLLKFVEHFPGFHLEFFPGMDVNIIFEPVEHVLEVLVLEGGHTESFTFFNLFAFNEGFEIFFELIEIFKEVVDVIVFHVLGV